MGGDQFADESSKTGEELDDRMRGEMLDVSLEILVAAWSGEPVNHRGGHYLVDDMRFLPRPVQRPRVSTSRTRISLARSVGAVRDLRGDDTVTYDIAVELAPGSDVAPYAEAGATWWMTASEPGVSLDEVRGLIREGPAG